MSFAKLPAFRGTLRQNKTKLYKDPTERAEAIKHVVARYGKQSISFKVLVNSQGNFTEASYNLASYIGKHKKLFTKGEYINEALLSYKETVFDNLPNKESITSRINYIVTSFRTVQRLGLDENVDVNGIPRLAVMARYCDCDTTNMREELCFYSKCQTQLGAKDLATAV
ncbi:unnamed protein product [Lepeophtheirus salmonis]|uniref:(salmon louse) hypothetical protein n=1 Tax=Lepeophtheirus salmonis TaxID=72036 RepID=A0A7R8CK34_LEPSM|nr:unnamed protein product [Lepeophtheirus salmonis]CAF2817181.1 unnamed protein product [Lepeophtheirus salmonis]